MVARGSRLQARGRSVCWIAPLVLVLALGLVPSGGLAYADGWITPCIDCPKYITNLTEHRLQLDAAGLPHVAYGGDHLYYARHDGTNWIYTTVDASAGVGAYASLDLDANGRPHISYQDSTHYDLRYAWWDGHSWQMETVDSEGQLGVHTSIVVDDNGNPHIGYSAYGTGLLKYAYHDAQGWHLETVEQWIEVQGISIATDEGMNPHILYYVKPYAGGKALKYTYRDNAGWHTETIDEPERTGSSLSLALDFDGNPHVSYTDASYPDQALKYAHKDASGWHTRFVDSGGNYSRDSPSLILDAGGYPHIAFFFWNSMDSPLPVLRYAYQDPQGWHTVVVGDQGAFSSLALDELGHPHITYLTRDTLYHTHQDTEGWHTELLDRGSDVGQDVSLALDQDSVLHVSYYDSTNRDLKYAYAQANVWQIETVASEGDVGLGSSLALDSQGSPCVSFYDDAVLAVLYSCKIGQVWLTETIASYSTPLLLFPRATSLALDAAGHPHVVYEGMEGLVYAYRNSSEWQIETPDPSCSYCAQDSALALDVFGNPHIGYLAENSSALKYTYRDAEGWHIETVRALSYGSFGNVSLRLDDSPSPHISFRESVGLTNYVRHSYKDSSGAWQVETLPDAGWGGTALGLDADGKAHIAYMRHSGDPSVASDLTHAYRSGNDWQVESIAQTGGSTSVALQLNSAGALFIAYHDSANRDLRYSLRVATDYAIYLPMVLR